MRKIIGLNGLIGSGKDTVAQYLVQKYNFKRVTFASKLKDAISVIFDLPRNALEGITKEDRAWRESPLEFWSKELRQQITPRKLMQLVGTECIRNGLNEDIWALLVKKEILENPDINLVISDVRLPNEVSMLKTVNGEIWNIERKLPIWWQDSINYNKSPKQELPHSLKTIHYTEWALAGYNFDKVIHNIGDIENLYIQIDNIFNKY